MIAAAVTRRLHAGCENPGSCDWFRIVCFMPGRGGELERLKLCDFHDEVRELGVAKASKTRATVSAGAAIALHVAAWRVRA